LIWEPNAFPGLTNRWLSRVVSLCCVVFEEAANYLQTKRWQRVPMPVRQEIEEMKPRIPASAAFRILIFGGSQGSRVLNNVIVDLVAKGGSWLKTTEFVHQTGAGEYERVKAQYERLPAASRGQVQCLPYLDDMPERYRWADLVIARSGTGTLSELAACAKAALLVPLPTAADDHQRKNAEALVKIGGARMILQNEFNADRLLKEIEDLRDNPQKVAELEKNVQRFHQAKAAEKMAQIILGLTDVGPC
jgi:UDP-N-acetylglucosamine--N-acetylmuramyl-(pentapeptide) pyrophosphoryl-undecaprenol N-acetylglucosamine transferase